MQDGEIPGNHPASNARDRLQTVRLRLLEDEGDILAAVFNERVAKCQVCQTAAHTLRICHFWQGQHTSACNPMTINNFFETPLQARSLVSSPGFSFSCSCRYGPGIVAPLLSRQPHTTHIADSFRSVSSCILTKRMDQQVPLTNWGPMWSLKMWTRKSILHSFSSLTVLPSQPRGRTQAPSAPSFLSPLQAPFEGSRWQVQI